MQPPSETDVRGAGQAKPTAAAAPLTGAHVGPCVVAQPILPQEKVRSLGGPTRGLGAAHGAVQILHHALLPVDTKKKAETVQAIYDEDVVIQI
jgi:hypothetical protein